MAGYGRWRADEDPDEPLADYTVGMAARTLGIPVATLRSWNRRYGLGPSQHRPGRHRHYSQTDLAVAARMVDLVRAGVSPASAAATVRAMAGSAPVLGDVAAVLGAAQRLEAAELLGVIGAHITYHGVVATWNRLCRPAFAEIVDRQDVGGGLIDVEHLLSWAVATALHRVVPPLRTRAGRSPIVLACTAGENHVLPLEVLRGALAELGLPALLLGASVPGTALADALAKHERRPIVVLWSQSDETAVLPGEPRRSWSRVVLAGPGWGSSEWPQGVVRVRTLEEAIQTLQQAVIANLP
ncbi:MerR family transcriptional regulator [Nocardia sp. NPDC051756]|uniref:MerR family transcriptional regulator n=1 Tax=Nocardia sp. NPDC051756 TaxID=3154751 RepID=UPI00342C8CEE